nr:hypothetical protein [uncultured Helicobacter sp.]
MTAKAFINSVSKVFLPKLTLMGITHLIPKRTPLRFRFESELPHSIPCIILCADSI